MIKVLIAKREVNDVLEFQVQDYVTKSGYIKSGLPYVLTSESIMEDRVNLYKTQQGDSFTDVRVGGKGKSKALTTKKNSTDDDNISNLPTF